MTNFLQPILKTALAGVALILGATSAMAFTPDLTKIEDKTLTNRYPEGVTLSREAADQLLVDVKAAKSRLADESEYADRRCQENFFVNSCREDVRRAKLRQESRLGSLERAANKVVREDKARIEREKQQAREAKKAAGPEKRAVRKPQTKSKPQTTSSAQKRAAQVAERQAAADKRRAREAQNKLAYEQKLKERDARARQREKNQAERRAKEAKK